MNFIAKAVTTMGSFFRALHIERYMAALLAVFVLLTSPIDSGNHSQALGKQIHQRLEQTDRNSDRPKTTGEFLDEARGDVPLDERLHNITRDSAEAMKQLGQEYTSGVQENVRTAKDNVGEATKGLFGRG